MVGLKTFRPFFVRIQMSVTIKSLLTANHTPNQVGWEIKTSWIGINYSSSVSTSFRQNEYHVLIA